jgi:hypothetical protein
MIASIEPPQLEFSETPELESTPVEPIIPDISIRPLLVENLYYDSRRPFAAFPQKDFSNIPEPATLGLVITGLAALLAVRLTRKK